MSGAEEAYSFPEALPKYFPEPQPSLGTHRYLHSYLFTAERMGFCENSPLKTVKITKDIHIYA